ATRASRRLRLRARGAVSLRGPRAAGANVPCVQVSPKTRTDRVRAKRDLGARRPAPRSRGPDGLESAEGAQPPIPPLPALLGGEVGDLAQVAFDRLTDGRRRSGAVGVRSARRLGHDLVDDVELAKVPGRQPEGIGGILLLPRVLPEDRRAAL